MSIGVVVSPKNALCVPSIVAGSGDMTIPWLGVEEFLLFTIHETDVPAGILKNALSSVFCCIGECGEDPFSPSPLVKDHHACRANPVIQPNNGPFKHFTSVPFFVVVAKMWANSMDFSQSIRTTT